MARQLVSCGTGRDVCASCDTPDMDIELEADLNIEDDDGNNWTLIEMSDFDPAVVYPGAVLRAGLPGGASEVQVLRTELFLGATSTVRVLVTFRQTRLRSLAQALSRTNTD